MWDRTDFCPPFELRRTLSQPVILRTTSATTLRREGRVTMTGGECSHRPLPCYVPPQPGSKCVVNGFCESWRRAMRHRLQSEVTPLESALVAAGCEPKRAKAAISQEGYGMTTASYILSAYEAHVQNPSSSDLLEGVEVCSQCRPGTNTFCLLGSALQG